MMVLEGMFLLKRMVYDGLSLSSCCCGPECVSLVDALIDFSNDPVELVGFP